MMALGVNVAEINVTPPTGTTPYTGDSVRPENGLGFRICTRNIKHTVHDKYIDRDHWLTEVNIYTVRLSVRLHKFKPSDMLSQETSH